MHSLFRRAALGVSLITSAAIAAMAPARAAYPEHPITVIVPFVAGSNTDISARTVTTKLSEILHQPVIIDNRGGASGMIGAQVAARANPDGYTLLFGSSTTQSIIVSLFKTVPYDPLTDFASIARVGFAPMVLLVPAKSTVNSPTDLVKAIQAKGDGKASYGSSGSGSTPHLAGALLDKNASLKALHIPYETPSQGLTDLSNGTIDYMFYPPGPANGLISAGLIRPVAAVSPVRLPNLPNLPTMEQAGYPGFNLASSLGFYAPAKTPRAVIDTLYKAVSEALRDPTVQAAAEKAGMLISPLSPTDTDKATADEIAMYRNLIAISGAQQQ